MQNLMGGIKGSSEKPGLTPNVPDWARFVTEKKSIGIILETADPAKFSKVVAEACGREPPMPDRLMQVMQLPDNAVPMENDYEAFKAWLTSNLA